MKPSDKVLIIGAHGKIGQRLNRKLSSSNIATPVPFLRNADQKADFDQLRAGAVIGDLAESIDTLSDKFREADAVVFAAGSGGDSGADKTLEVDLEGAVRAIKAAEKAGAKRFIMVSAAGADDRSFWDEVDMKPYYIAKHYADEALRHSDLDYTIVRPVQLTDEPGKGQITVATDASGLEQEISRDDVASTIVTLLAANQHTRRTLAISAGDQPISLALGSV